jgi:hypothetical protein
MNIFCKELSNFIVGRRGAAARSNVLLLNLKLDGLCVANCVTSYVNNKKYIKCKLLHNWNESGNREMVALILRMKTVSRVG